MSFLNARLPEVSIKSHDDAVKLMRRLLSTAQKMRSDAVESLQRDGKLSESLLNSLGNMVHPVLFGKVAGTTLLDVLQAYADKADRNKKVDPQDAFNALSLISREPTFGIVWISRMGTQVPDADIVMRQIANLK